MTSTYPKYNEKIISMNALAPVAFLNNLKSSSLYQILVKFYLPLKQAVSLLGVHEFSLNNKFLSTISKLACKNAQSFSCRNVLFLFDGSESKHINCVSLFPSECEEQNICLFFISHFFYQFC